MGFPGKKKNNVGLTRVIFFMLPFYIMIAISYFMIVPATVFIVPGGHWADWLHSPKGLLIASVFALAFLVFGERLGELVADKVLYKLKKEYVSLGVEALLVLIGLSFCVKPWLVPLISTALFVVFSAVVLKITPTSISWKE